MSRADGVNPPQNRRYAGAEGPGHRRAHVRCGTGGREAAHEDAGMYLGVPFHFIQTTRVQLTMPGVVYFPILSRFGPRGRLDASTPERGVAAMA